jgi:hypothetical protein
MYTYMLYEAERPRTRSQQRELSTINGELAVAIRRPFRRFRANWHRARPVTPPTCEQPALRIGAFPAEATIPRARCN